MMISQTMGLTEAFRLPKGPFAVSLGQTVMKHSKPFIWLCGDLPYHVTDPSKVQVYCPMKYRDYAHRVDEHVPIWRQKVQIKSKEQVEQENSKQVHAAPVCPRDPKFLCLPCAPSAAVQTDGTGLDDLVSAPEMPLEESDDAPGFSEAAGRILMVRSRSMSCLLYTSPSPRDLSTSRMPSSA